ncbi:hypothetical protein C3K47_05350 [Solitalea longa]|uniref:Uncharacterized protein n=1 Tax=Solitalea longa TaxID=2079460 RepID=A0A2S5A5S9_9SPHI|nr:hypothetical protein [Solitalea longa]POY37950.1 hypothetical protein C3K47_05350 [Solitalea longa]
MSVEAIDYLTPKLLNRLKQAGYTSICEYPIYIPWFHQPDNTIEAAYLLYPLEAEASKQFFIIHTSWYSSKGKTYPISSNELEQLATETGAGISYQVLMF